MTAYRKTCVAVLAGMLFLGWSLAAVSASDISEGDTIERVLDLLGDPEAYIGTDSFEWLYYERGSVKLKDGHVVHASLIPAEEAEEIRARREEERIKRREAYKERRERLIEEGEALKRETLMSPEFWLADASHRVDFWRRFQQRYPDVPVSEHYAEALREYEKELAMQRREEQIARRISDLEDRVRDAEERALRAERGRYSRGLSVVRYSSPVAIRSSYGKDRVHLSAGRGSRPQIRHDGSRSAVRVHFGRQSVTGRAEPVVQRGSVDPSRLDSTFGPMPRSSSPALRPARGQPWTTAKGLSF